MLRDRALGVVAASLAVALLGCPPQDRGSRRGGDDDVLTAGQVIGVARAINTGEIDAANAVKSRLPQGAASGMVDMIIKDHTASLQELERVSVKLNLVPEESDISRDLQEDVEKTMDSWADKQGNELGEEFIDSQVDMHEKALKIIDDDLLKATTEPTLTEYLGKLRASVYHHLEMARGMQDDDVREHRGMAEPARDREEDLEKERESNEDAAEQQREKAEDAADEERDAAERQREANEDAAEQQREANEDAAEDARERDESRYQGGSQSQTGEPSGHMEGRPAGSGGAATGGQTDGGRPR
jgi:predicted outer membrane protein